MNSLNSWLMGHDQITLSERQRSMHTYVIDPHGDLFNHLTTFLARHPELWAKVILIDPTDPIWSVGFNPLEAVDRGFSERIALFMTDVCIKMWKLDVTNAPRLVWLLTNTFLALSSLGLTLLDLPRFLSDRQFREGQLSRTSIQAVRTSFEQEFPVTEKGAQQWIAPVLNKLGSFLFDPDVSVMFSGKSTIDFRGIMDNRLILLVNLPKGILSEGLSSLLAAFLVSHIQK